MNFEDIRTVALKEMKNLPGSYRCHETARRIAHGLELAGIQAEVKDGVATYDTRVLLKDFLVSMDLFQNLSEALKEEALGGKTKMKTRVLHSWCEIPGNENGTVVVDWHAYLKTSKDEAIENVLIIENKDNLPHKYDPVGITMRGWIIFRLFPPLFTRIRL